MVWLAYPAWSTRCFLVLGAFFVAIQIREFKKDDAKAKARAANETAKETEADQQRGAEFSSFQRQYLLVYLITCFADWLQGTHMYDLYASYDMDIGALFLTGFASSAVFGTFVGSYVDRMGRKKGCVVFCVLEIIINLMEHVPNFWVLVVGRVLGGISTSLLFSAFESWMITAHRKRGFSEEQLQRTFSLASAGNGLVAVAAGAVAQVSSDMLGDIGPFQVAIALTVLAVLPILAWEENYGAEQVDMTAQFKAGWRAIRSDRRIQLLGIIGSLFEGAMFTFVFMWVPVLQSIVPGGKDQLPNGVVFSCFMMSISIGGSLVGSLSNYKVESVTVWLLAVSSASMLVPVLAPTNFPLVFGSFLVFEACVGLWFGCSASMRSQYLPQGALATIMGIFRVPLNALVVTGTKMTDMFSPVSVYTTIAVWLAVAMVLQIWLSKLRVEKDKKQF